jgi:hypothetical protein
MTDTERITNEVCNRFLAPDGSALYAPVEEHENPMDAAMGIRNGLILDIIFWVVVALCFCPWSCK